MTFPVLWKFKGIKHYEKGLKQFLMVAKFYVQKSFISFSDVLSLIYVMNNG